MDKEAFKIKYGITEIFLEKLSKLVALTFAPDNSSRKKEENISFKTEFLCMNFECGYIGRYYTLNDITIWLGFDFRRKIGERFCITFFGGNEAKNKFIVDKLSKQKEKFLTEYSYEPDNNNWYSISYDETLLNFENCDISNLVSEFENRIKNLGE